MKCDICGWEAAVEYELSRFKSSFRVETDTDKVCQACLSALEKMEREARERVLEFVEKETMELGQRIVDMKAKFRWKIVDDDTDG